MFCSKKKMNSLRKNKETWRSGGRAVLFVALALFAAALALLFLAPRGLATFALDASGPLLRVERGARSGFAAAAGYFRSKSSLAAENAALRSDLAAAQGQALLLDAYKKENDALRALVGRSSSRKIVLAAVLAKPPRSAYDTLLLDAGTAEGVAPGDLVFSDDTVIGKIAEAGKDDSKAVLFSTPGQKLAASLPAAGGSVNLDLSGRGAGNFIGDLPKGVNVTTGDAVRLPGLAMQIIGAVFATESTPSDSFQTILVKSPVNVSLLDWVEVETAK